MCHPNKKKILVGGQASHVHMDSDHLYYRGELTMFVSVPIVLCDGMAATEKYDREVLL